ncbi:hypothetical protein [Actinomadura sp. 6N118]|uniref:hypothetical protein n=1 Tax=Actinomadura sp. 6N118 TaxID=3375151 RepID=UPI00379BB87E
MKLVLTFTSPQKFGAVEAERLDVEAAELVLLDASGEAVLRVPAEVIQSVNPGAAARTERLRDHAPNHGRPWTDAERATLRELVSAGASMVEICERLGRSSNGIRSEMRRLGLTG